MFKTPFITNNLLSSKRNIIYIRVYYKLFVVGFAKHNVSLFKLCAPIF